MFRVKNIKLIFNSIHMKPLALVSAIGLGLFFVACIFYPIFYRHAREWFKNRSK